MHFTGEAAAGGAPGPAPWTRRRRLGPRAVRPPLPLGARSAGGGGRWTLRRAPLPSPPDGDAPGTAGQAPPLPFGLYLTGLEALRRSHSFSKGIWFRARVISQNPLAFDTPPPPPRYLPPPSLSVLPATPLSGRPVGRVSWCRTRSCSGYSDSRSVPGVDWIPAL